MSFFNYRSKWDLVPGYIFQGIMRPVVYLILKLFFGLTIENKEVLDSLPNEGGLIVAANHIHELDGFLLPAAIPLLKMPKPFHPVTREPGFYRNKGLRGYLYDSGFFFYLMGAFPAIGGKQNYAESLRNQVKLINDGEMVLIFPEGKVTSPRAPHKARGGAGFLSVQTSTPVLPIYLEGLNSSDQRNEIRSRKHMRVVLGDLIHPSKVLDEYNKNTEEASKKVSQEALDTIYSLAS